MTYLLDPRAWMAIGALFVAWYLIDYGNRTGSNSKRVAVIEAQLADTNARLKGYTSRDEQAAIDADVARSEGYDRAVLTLKLAPKDRCPATQAMIQAFEMVR